MGSEIHVHHGERLEITAEARLNPDVDRLNRIELVQGATSSQPRPPAKRIASRSSRSSRRITACGSRSAPLGLEKAVRNTTQAHTAATYVIVDDEPFWKRSALPSLVAHQHQVLQDILTGPLLPDQDLEEYETRDLLIAEWPKQREMLRDRVAQADKLYQHLLVKAGLPPLPVTKTPAPQ